MRTLLACLFAAALCLNPSTPEPAMATTDLSPASAAFRSVDRIAGANRFAVAASTAKLSFPDWQGVTDVVVACGDDAAAADPLAAASLCWAYDAPLLLTSRYSSPREIERALGAIKAANGSVKVHVIGGPVSVPETRLTEMRAIVGKSSVERLPYGDRYETARQVALRSRSVASARGKTLPNNVIIVNGAASFFDALTASTMSARQGTPLFLITTKGPSTAVMKTIRSFSPGVVWCVGHTLPSNMGVTVAEQVSDYTNWVDVKGRDYTDTAAKFANEMVEMGSLSATSVAIPAKLPDALTAGAYIGRAGGVMLYTHKDLAPFATTYWLLNRDDVERLIVFGGEASVSPAGLTDLRSYADPTMTWKPRLSYYDSWLSVFSDSMAVQVYALDQSATPLDISLPTTAVWTITVSTPAKDTIVKTYTRSKTLYPGRFDSSIYLPVTLPRGATVSVSVTSTHGGKTYRDTAP